MRTSFALRLALAAALVLLGGATEIGAEPRASGTLRVAVPAEIKTLDPVLAADDASRLIILNVYDQLFEYDHLARPFELKPCLAAALPEVSEDRLTWTIRLLPDVRFPDDPCFEGGAGRTLCAADVVFCLTRLMDAGLGGTGRWLLERRVVGIDAFVAASASVAADPKRSTYALADGYPEVAGFKVVDEATLEIRLVKPYPALPWVLATSYGSIYPPEAVRHYGADLATHMVSTGPYALNAYISPKRLLLARNPTYREDRYPLEGNAQDEAAGRLEDKGALLPLNDLVIVLATPDEMTEWTWFSAAEVDLALVPRDARWSIVAPTGDGRFQLMPQLAKRGVSLHDDPYLEVFYEAFNMRDPVLGQPAGEQGLALRRAISLATDDLWVIERLHGGLAERVFGPLLPEFPEYSDGYRNPWSRQPDESDDDVLDLARETLADAGLEGGKGVPTITKDVLDFQSSRMRFERFQKRMKSIGLTFEANYVSWAELRKRINAGEARMWNISWHLDYPDAENLFQLFHAPYAPVPNDSRYDNPEFDALYEEALATPPGDERAALYDEMQEIVNEDCVYRWRFRRRRLAVTQPWLTNYKFNDIAPRFFKYCRVKTGPRNEFLKARAAKDDAGD